MATAVRMPEIADADLKGSGTHRDPLAASKRPSRRV